MNPMWLWLAAGHFARDFLPKELVPGFGGPGQAAPGVQPSPAQAAAPPVTEVLPRAPIGPFPLDAGMEEDYELAVWRACEDQNASPQQIAAFAQGALQDGFPIAYGVLYKRAIELAQFQESLRVQEAVMRRSQASPPSPPASPQGMPARHEGSSPSSPAPAPAPSPALAPSGPGRAHTQGASSPAPESDPSEMEAASSSVSPTYSGAAHAAPVVGAGVGNGRARGKASRKEAPHAGRNGVANGATMTPSADESVDVHVEP